MEKAAEKIEETLEIHQAYDTLYGFILAQEPLQRATLWTALDNLWYWVRKAAGDAPTVEEKATSNTGPKQDFTDTGESGAAYDAEAANRDS